MRGMLTWSFTCRSSRTDILTIMGAEFLATIFIGCLNACLVQPVAYVERTVFYRERAAGVSLFQQDTERRTIAT